MSRLQSRNDPLEMREFIKNFDRLGIIACTDNRSTDIAKVGVFRSDRRIIDTRSEGVDRCRFALFVFQHDGVEAVHDPLFTVGKRGGMLSKLGAHTQRLDPMQLNRIIDKSGKNPLAFEPPPTHATA